MRVCDHRGECAQCACCECLRLYCVSKKHMNLFTDKKYIKQKKTEFDVSAKYTLPNLFATSR